VPRVLGLACHLPCVAQWSTTVNCRQPVKTCWRCGKSAIQPPSAFLRQEGPIAAGHRVSCSLSQLFRATLRFHGVGRGIPRLRSFAQTWANCARFSSSSDSVVIKSRSARGAPSPSRSLRNVQTWRPLSWGAPGSCTVCRRRPRAESELDR
jgi:hypothetical protein